MGYGTCIYLCCFSSNFYLGYTGQGSDFSSNFYLGYTGQGSDFSSNFYLGYTGQGSDFSSNDIKQTINTKYRINTKMNPEHMWL
jgi:hypothetical protein